MQLVQALIWILGAVPIIAALLDRSPLLQLSGCGPSESVQTSTEGALVVDIFENTDKEAIWQGSATKRLLGDDATLEFIDEAVTTSFAEFPDRYRLAKSRFIATGSSWETKISIRHETINQLKTDTGGAAEGHTWAQ